MPAHYICNECSYEYDPDEGDQENGIAAGTLFPELPDDWVCPACGAPKTAFVRQGEEETPIA